MDSAADKNAYNARKSASAAPSLCFHCSSSQHYRHPAGCAEQGWVAQERISQESSCELCVSRSATSAELTRRHSSPVHPANAPPLPPALPLILSPLTLLHPSPFNRFQRRVVGLASPASPFLLPTLPSPLSPLLTSRHTPPSRSRK